MEKRLEEALRQYKHNHGKGGFVFAYDKYTVDCIFADLRKIVEDQRMDTCSADEYCDSCADMRIFLGRIDQLLNGGGVMGECEKCGRLACACPEYLDLNYVCKSDLRKLVEDLKKEGEFYGSDRESLGYLDAAEKINKLLEGE